MRVFSVILQQRTVTQVVCQMNVNVRHQWYERDSLLPPWHMGWATYPSRSASILPTDNRPRQLNYPVVFARLQAFGLSSVLGRSPKMRKMLACQRENNCTAHSKNVKTPPPRAQALVACQLNVYLVGKLGGGGYLWHIGTPHTRTVRVAGVSEPSLPSLPKIAVDHVSRTPASRTRSCKWPPPGEMWGGVGRSMRC